MESVRPSLGPILIVMPSAVPDPSARPLRTGGPFVSTFFDQSDAAMKSIERVSIPPLATVAADEGQSSAVAWDRVMRRLRAEFGEDVFSSWFARLEFEALIEDSAQLSVPTRFLKSWIQAHYLDKVLALLSAELPAVARVALVVRTAVRAQPPRPTSAIVPGVEPAPEPVQRASCRIAKAVAKQSTKLSSTRRCGWPSTCGYWPA